LFVGVHADQVPAAAPTPKPTPARRTNADRSAATRLRLLDATVESLMDVGWARTSTTEVTRRAEVSRGAQVHHFPTKEDLVLAAVEHLLVRRHAEFDATFRELPDEQRSPLDAMRLLRERCFGRSFDAWLELLVAARTDAALHRRLVEMDERFFERSVATYNDLFPELTGGDPELARVGLGLAFTVLDGLAIRRLLCASDDELDETLEVFVSLATATADPTTTDHPPETTALAAVTDPEEPR
jgi:AcrR family transcriptional regulator